MQIYTDKTLKYPLTEDEYKQIDKVWEFSDLFNFRTLYINEYRTKIISIMQSKYSLLDFLVLEDILNKLFWNLRWLLYPLWLNPNITQSEYQQMINSNYDNHDTLPDSLLLCQKKKYNNPRELQDEIDNFVKNNYYRSFINKLIMIDNNNKIIYTKNIEGSAEIFNKNYFNLYTATILTNRKLYEEIMQNPLKITNKQVTLPEFYYEHDYAFPNINYCAYRIHDDEKERLNRIRRMYYSRDAEKNWYKLIRHDTTKKERAIPIMEKDSN